MTKREKMYQEIEKHGENLNNIFHTSKDNVSLYKSLRRLETKAHHATTCLCNTNTLDLLELNRFTGYDVHQTTEEEQDIFFDKITKSLEKILNYKNADVDVFINFDARGYALKIRLDDTDVKSMAIYKDWGGYGILAPDFN